MPESARVLTQEGVFLYDTINRTPLSKVLMSKLFQEWKLTCFMPPHLHD
jgi:2-polyprenyl-6-hydroxyphenyl methylase/3-demethylubiquinone-9 3-methyltransferase